MKLHDGYLPLQYGDIEQCKGNVNTESGNTVNGGLHASLPLVAVLEVLIHGADEPGGLCEDRWWLSLREVDV